MKRITLSLTAFLFLMFSAVGQASVIIVNPGDLTWIENTPEEKFLTGQSLLLNSEQYYLFEVEAGALDHMATPGQLPLTFRIDDLGSDIIAWQIAIWHGVGGLIDATGLVMMEGNSMTETFILDTQKDLTQVFGVFGYGQRFRDVNGPVSVMVSGYIPANVPDAGTVSSASVLVMVLLGLAVLVGMTRKRNSLTGNLMLA